MEFELKIMSANCTSMSFTEGIEDLKQRQAERPNSEFGKFDFAQMTVGNVKFFEYPRQNCSGDEPSGTEQIRVQRVA